MMTLNGCAATVDTDETPTPVEETPGSASETLIGGTIANADATRDGAGDCDAAPVKAAASTDPYQQYMSIIDTDGASVDATLAGNPCRAACRCCRWGNRFCCSHCKWCSGPIGPYGVSTEVLAP